jgi:hypothetical protein
MALSRHGPAYLVAYLLAHFAALEEVLEGGERVLERRLPIPLVGLVEVDVVGAESPEAGLTGPDEMMAGGARVVRPSPIKELASVARMTPSRQDPSA